MAFLYGKPINEDLSCYLRRYTDKLDIANVSVETGTSISTIRSVILRSNSVTNHNSKAIIALMKIAVKKCDQNIVDSKKVKQELNTLLK